MQKVKNVGQTASMFVFVILTIVEGRRNPWFYG